MENIKKLVEEFANLNSNIVRDTTRRDGIKNILDAKSKYLNQCCGKWFDSGDYIYYVKKVITDVTQSNFGTMEIYKFNYRHTPRRSWNAISLVFTNIDEFSKISNLKEVQIPQSLEKYLYSLAISSECYDYKSDCSYSKIYRKFEWKP